MRQQIEGVSLAAFVAAAYFSAWLGHPSPACAGGLTDKCEARCFTHSAVGLALVAVALVATVFAGVTLPHLLTVG